MATVQRYFVTFSGNYRESLHKWSCCTPFLVVNLVIFGRSIFPRLLHQFSCVMCEFQAVPRTLADIQDGEIQYNMALTVSYCYKALILYICGDPGHAFKFSSFRQNYRSLCWEVSVNENQVSYMSHLNKTYVLKKRWYSQHS